LVNSILVQELVKLSRILWQGRKDTEPFPVALAALAALAATHHLGSHSLGIADPCHKGTARIGAVEQRAPLHDGPRDIWKLAPQLLGCCGVDTVRL
jgi:hypothetical protein